MSSVTARCRSHAVADFFAFALLCLAAGVARADVLFSQPPTSSGTIITSAYWDPDGSDYDQFVWDRFLLPAAGNISEIRWRGAYPGGGTTGGNITMFEIAIYASIPAGTQPDLGFLYPGPLAHFEVPGTCGETFAGNVGGTNWYDYHFVLPQPFLAAGNTPYWVFIVAWQPGFPTWGLASGSGGNGTHFARIPGYVGYQYIIGNFDASFSLIGTNANCSVPTITLNPTPVTGCANSTNAVFDAAATGTGPFAYRWYLNGNAVFDGPNGGGHGGGAFISGATTPTLTITNASYWADVGTYTCMISNACGPAITQGAVLAISWGGPNLTSSPAPTSSCAGGSVSLTVAASNGPISYLWKKDGILISDGPTPWGSVISGATTDTLHLDNTQSQDQGSYQCVVTNPCSSINSNPATVSICFANCDCSTASPILNVNDFTCFLNEFAAGNPAANCDGSTSPPVLNVNDFTCFLNHFAAGCP